MVKKIIVDRAGYACIEPSCNTICLEYLNAAGPQENFGWRQAILYLIEIGKIKSFSRVAVIVDSDLGKVPSYNDRRQPIYGKFFLPHNITLVYASADKGNNIANKLIIEADRVAKGCLIRLKNEFVPPRHGRIWDINYV